LKFLDDEHDSPILETMAYKRQHYIPKFYLEGFADPVDGAFLYQYEKGKDGFVKVSPANTALQKYYYEFTLPDGNKDRETIEKALSGVEQDAARVFRKIEVGQSLDHQEKSLFSLFLTIMAMRVPAYRQDYESGAAQTMKEIMRAVASDPEKFAIVSKRVRAKHGDEDSVSDERVRKFILNGKYDLKPPSELSLQAVTELPVEIAEIIAKMHWSFLIAPMTCPFVTSDNPFFYDDPTLNPLPKGSGLLYRNVEVTFPMTPKIAFLGTWYNLNRERIQISEFAVREVNRRTVTCALRFVYASEGSTLLAKLVQKRAGNPPKMAVTSLQGGDMDKGVLIKHSRECERPQQSLVELIRKSLARRVNR
jgi:hypothetical protein